MKGERNVKKRRRELRPEPQGQRIRLEKAKIQKQKIIDDLLKMKNQFVEYCEENNLDLTDAFELVGFTKGGMIRKTKAKFKDPVTGKLWAGRGKTPKWYLERITQGFTEQDLLA